MTLLNGTDGSYRVRVRPVLLAQKRNGGLTVHDDRSARRRAARVVAVQANRFELSPGEARSILARIRRVPRSGSFYGGVLYQATPGRKRGSAPQIRNVLQLTASVLLDPTSSRRRVSFATAPTRAEQAGRRTLRVLVPVTNRGNAYTTAVGRVLVRDAAGKVVARPALRHLRVLPGATVDLRGAITKQLPPGAYRLSAAIRGPGRPARAVSSMRLFGVNQVATRAAKLVEVPAPTAYRGEKVDIQGRFRNTGNVPYSPIAQVRVRPIVGGRPERVALTQEMDADRASPGEQGTLKAELRLPGAAPAYEITVRLLDGRREIDSRAVTVTPTTKPSLPARAKVFITEHALLLLGLVFALLVGGLIQSTRYARRLKAAASRSERPPPPDGETITDTARPYTNGAASAANGARGTTAGLGHQHAATRPRDR